MSGYLDYIRKTAGDRADKILSQLGKGFEEVGGQKPGQLIYPQDLFSPESAPFILFFAVHPTKVNVILDKIALYMPRDVGVTYGINFGEATNIYEFMKDMWNNKGSVIDYYNDPAAAAAIGYSAFRGAHGGAGLMGKVLGGTAGMVSGAFGAANRSNAIGQAISIHQKKTLNPHMAATFEGMNFRRHQFQFDLVARNKDESETINQIIYKFKLHAHPEAGNPDSQATFWEWPSAWHIGLFSPARKYLYNISTCHITNIGVNYTAGGVRSFFSDTGAPVAVRLSLEFMETELMTRGRIRQGF